MCGLSRQCGWSFEACCLPMRGADGQMPTLRTSSCSGDRCVGRRTLGRRGARGATWRVLLTFRAGERVGLSPQRAKSCAPGTPKTACGSKEGAARRSFSARLKPCPFTCRGLAFGLGLGRLRTLRSGRLGRTAGRICGAPITVTFVSNLEPQGLKPAFFCGCCGTTKVVP
jgi:hypothetical protein